jgi:hypothetical protein
MAKLLRLAILLCVALAVQLGQAYRLDAGEVDCLSPNLLQGVAEATLAQDLGLRVMKTAQLRGETLTPGTYAQALEAAVHRRQLWGQLAGGITALVAGQDVDAAVLSATHATENNFALTALPYLMGAGYTVWTAYTIYDAYCQGGPEAALKQAGVETLTFAAGGLAGKVVFKVGGVVYGSASKAWTAYLSHNPQVARVAQALGGKAVALQGKVGSSKAAQGLVKLDHKADTLVAKVWPGSAKRLSQSVGRGVVLKTRPQIGKGSLDRKTQAWNIRPGKEWKAHVYGKAQKTGTSGHAEESYRKTIEAFRGKLPGVGEVERVHLNEGLGKVTGLPIKPNTRPDVTIVTKDGRVHQIEVASKTDNRRDLKARIDAARKRLPEQMQGTTKVFNIGDKS